MIFDTEPVNNVISFRFEIFFILYDIASYSFKTVCRQIYVSTV